MDIVLKGTNLKDDIYYIYDELEENLPYFIDVSIYGNLKNDNLKEHIEKYGKVIWSK